MSREFQRKSKRAVEFDVRTQAQKFEDAARAIGADEDEAAFKAKLTVIARQKPKDLSEEEVSVRKIHGK